MFPQKKRKTEISITQTTKHHQGHCKNHHCTLLYSYHCIFFIHLCIISFYQQPMKSSATVFLMCIFFSSLYSVYISLFFAFLYCYLLYCVLYSYCLFIYLFIYLFISFIVYSFHFILLFYLFLSIIYH